MHDFLPPLTTLEKIKECKEKKAKVLDLSCCWGKLLTIPPEVFSLSHLEELNLRDNAIQVIPEKIQ